MMWAEKLGTTEREMEETKEKEERTTTGAEESLGPWLSQGCVGDGGG